MIEIGSLLDMKMSMKAALERNLFLSDKRKKEWLVNEISFEMEMGEINRVHA